MPDRLIECGNGVAEMMEASTTLYGARQFTFRPIRCDQFQVGSVFGKLQELDIRGLQRIVDHGRRQVIPEAEAKVYSCGLDGRHGMTYVMKPQVRWKYLIRFVKDSFHPSDRASI